jgi:tetratricopeptide (TPR) repeat protein
MNRLCPAAAAILCILSAAAAVAQENPARGLLRQAQDRQLSGDTLGAIEQYRAALAANPDFGEAEAGLAECFFRLEEYEEALPHVLRARRYDQANLALAVLEGRVRIGLGEMDKARSLFEGVLAREKNNLEAQFALAELDIATGRERNAAQKYLDSLRIRPDSQQALLALAVLNESRGEAREAQKYLETALRFHADDPRVRYAAARFALQQGEPARADSHLQAALAVHPGFVEARLLLAQVLMEQQRAAEAAQTMRDLLSEHRDLPMAWYLLGLAQERAGDLAQAVSSLVSAARLAPEDELARLALENLALAKLEIKDESRRKLALPHLERGRRFEERNLLEKALAEYRRCLRLDPESRDGRLAYAGVYRLLGYPAKYRLELQVLRRLGYQDAAVTDGIEIVDSQLLDTVAADWGLDQYALERRGYTLAAFWIRRQLPELHYDAGRDLVEYLKDQLRRFDTIVVPDAEPLAQSFEDAFRRARSLGADYFLMLRFEESERSFSAELEQYLARTGTRVASYRAFRTGNDRVQECLGLLTAQLEERLPAWGRLVTREFDTGVVDLGTLDGIKAEDELVVVKRGKVRLRNDGVGLAMDEKDIVGGFRVVRPDERISEGLLSRRSFFDLINPGDELVYQQAPAAPAPSQPEEAGAGGLLRRIYRLLGLAGAGGTSGATAD